MKTIPIPPQIIAYISLAIIAGVTLYLVFKKIGLIEDLTRKEKQLEKETKEELSKEEQNIELANVIISDMKEFNPKWWQDANKSELINEVQARQLAGAIKAAFGWFDDDESKIYSIFRSLSNKYQVSQIAFYYAANFNADLVADLVNSLNKEELNTVVKIVKNLPN